MKNRVPTLKKAIGVDFGPRRTGIAISSGGFAPRPLGILPVRGNYGEVAQELVKIGKQNSVDGYVVGIPVTERGTLYRASTDSQQGKRARNFAMTLASIAHPMGLHVMLVDEGRSSQAAEEMVFGTSSNGGHIDDVAACIILERYFAAPRAAIRVRLPYEVQEKRDRDALRAGPGRVPGGTGPGGYQYRGPVGPAVPGPAPAAPAAGPTSPPPGGDDLAV